MKQEIKVYNHLLAHKTITSMEAFRLYNITRLSAVIYNLRSHGHRISMEKVYGVNAEKEPYNYGVYRLEQ